MFADRYGDVFKGDKNWQGIKVAEGQTYQWDIGSTYVQNPPYFDGLSMTPEPVSDIIEARVLSHFRRLDHHGSHQPGRKTFARLRHRLENISRSIRSA